jgi:N4-gp56 family major capsid protein
MADSIIDVPEVDVTRMDLILETVQRELAFASKMRPLISDVSEFAQPGLKSISFPKLGSLEVQKLGTGEQGAAQALTASEDQLNLDEHAHINYILKKRATIQSRLRWEQAMAGRAGSAHGRSVDKDILDQMLANAALTVTYNAGAIEDNCLSIVKELDEADALESDRFVVFRPAQKKLLLGVANFVQADRYGSNMPLVSGELGMAYGLRFVMSNATSTEFVDDVMLAFQKEACAVGFQMDPEVDEQKAIEYGAGSKRVAIDQLYGVKALQAGAHIVKVS